MLPNLKSHFDEEIIRAAIHTIDIDHDYDRLSYFDFVTSLFLLQECESNMKKKTFNSESLPVSTKKEQRL